ncbi:MAG: hypothetical protein R3C27_11185 [Hyphomonadaceae bacterium]
MTDTFALQDVVGPILTAIGYDFARLRELSDDAIATVHNAQLLANFALVAQLVDRVGDKEVAERMIVHARHLSPEKARKRRDILEVIMSEGRLPTPRLMAAHIALGLDIQTALAAEVERRMTGAPMN